MSDPTLASFNSKLFVYTPIEKKEPIDQILEGCYDKMISLKKADSSGKQISQYVIVGRQQHDEITFGYLYGILIDSGNAADYFRDMLLQNLDQFEAISHVCSELITLYLHRLQECSKRQMCWLVEQGAKSGVKRLSSLMFQLLRELQQLSHGILEYVVSICEANINWIISTTLLSGMVAYTIIPLIKSYPDYPNLKHRQSILCVALIRSKWNECARIGRDFLRALHSVCTIPEFYTLWQDIIRCEMPEQTSGQLEQILSQRTQRKFLLSRLTHDIERKIAFLLNEVRLSEDIEFYKEWIIRDLSITNRIDLIRYLCSAACEQTSMQSEDRRPQRDEIRKHILYWLVIAAEGSNNLDVINTRFAFLFDWLIYQSGRHHTIDPHVTRCFNWVTRYLTELGNHYIPQLNERLSFCVKNFIKDIWGIEQMPVTPASTSYNANQITTSLTSSNNIQWTSKDLIIESQIQHQNRSVHPLLDNTKLEKAEPSSLSGYSVISPISLLSTASSSMTSKPLITTADIVIELDDNCLDIRNDNVTSNTADFSSSDENNDDLITQQDEHTAIDNQDVHRKEIHNVSASLISSRESTNSQLNKIRKNEDLMLKTRLCIAPPVRLISKQNIDKALDSIPDSHRHAITKLMKTKSKLKRKSLLDSLVTELSSKQHESYSNDSSPASTINKLSKDELNSLAILVLNILKYSIPRPIMPKQNDYIIFGSNASSAGSSNDVNKKKMYTYLSKKLLQRPLFTFFECVCSDNTLLPLLESMYSLQPRLGYLFLLFLQLRSDTNNEHLRIYQQLLLHLEDDDDDSHGRRYSSSSLIEKDLVNCHKDEIELFYFILPFTCRATPQHAFSTENNGHCGGVLVCVNSEPILKLIVSSISSHLLGQLACCLSTGEIILFAESKSLHRLIQASTQWTPNEQSNFWMLMQCQLSLKLTSQFFARVRRNPIGSATLMQSLIASKPMSECLKAVFDRQPPDMYSTTILIEWCNRDLPSLVQAFLYYVNNSIRSKNSSKGRENKKSARIQSGTGRSNRASMPNKTKKRRRIKQRSSSSSTASSDSESCEYIDINSNSNSNSPIINSDSNSSSSSSSVTSSSDESLSKKKKKTRTANDNRLDLVNMLCHLDCIRTSTNSNCLRFLVDSSICSCLCQISEGIRKCDRQKFEDLIKLVKDFQKDDALGKGCGSSGNINRKIRTRRSSQCQLFTSGLSSTVGDSVHTETTLCQFGKNDKTNTVGSKRSDSSRQDLITSPFTTNAAFAAQHQQNDTTISDPYGWKPSIKLKSVHGGGNPPSLRSGDSTNSSIPTVEPAIADNSENRIDPECSTVTNADSTGVGGADSLHHNHRNHHHHHSHQLITGNKKS
ncbi:hypothetical protein GJ496_005246 [Pomphorhynchus laevis]|nr:hypothetical protein GJ496_005246 [Pomphorhynchus laevis]